MLEKVLKFLTDHYNSLGGLLDELEAAVKTGAGDVEKAAGKAVQLAERLRGAPLGPTDQGGPLQPTSENFMRAPAVALSAGTTLGTCKRGILKDGTGACGTIVTDQTVNGDGKAVCPRCHVVLGETS